MLEQTNRRIILITGGQRSGKSHYAEELALRLSPSPIYLATARVWDEEFAHRVRLHKERRGPEWVNIEREKDLWREDLIGKVVLIDCVTLWATNYFFDADSNLNEALESLKMDFDKLIQQEATFIFVSNEIGLGGVSENQMQRRFTDLQGWINQYIAQYANEVWLMVAGIPLEVKRQKEC